MDFGITNLTRSNIDRRFLEKVGARALRFLKIKLPEISLVLVDEKKIKDLNKKYRKKNEVTDVLAFDYGEIFICLPQAKKQAKKIGHSLKKELAILLIHGILHLAGYKDDTEKNRVRMAKKQNRLIASLG